MNHQIGTNMAKFSFQSRYRKTDQIIVDGVETVGTWKQPNYLIERPKENFILRYYVTNAVEGRPDLIANQLYGTPTLDWVLIAFNSPTECLNWPTAGTTIEYPSQDLVLSQL